MTDKEQEQEENGMIDEDNTQDPVEDEQQLVRVKEWINCCHRDTIELNDVLSNFPDISVVLTEGMKVIIMFKLFCRFYHLQTLFLFRLILLGSSEIMEKLVEEGVLSKTGKETYAINKDKKLEYEFPVVKEEIDGQIPQAFDRGLQFEDRIYMKDVDHCEPNSKFKKTGFHLNGDGLRQFVFSISNLQLFDIGSNYDVSTCGVLHSIGSDLTRMKVTSETNYSDSGSGQKTIKAKEPGNTPISRPVISRESFAQGKENGRTNGIENQGDEADTIICSKSSQDKRPRKTSAVKEPINQNMKRQRSEAQ
ncbi:hypothetical protein JHK87_048631 [Glycine soja]|nr:hypothetical protein JHK87_048631 [Glycine soja]